MPYISRYRNLNAYNPNCKTTWNQIKHQRIIILASYYYYSSDPYI